jgi:hypothetical protein
MVRTQTRNGHLSIRGRHPGKIEVPHDGTAEAVRRITNICKRAPEVCVPAQVSQDPTRTALIRYLDGRCAAQGTPESELDCEHHMSDTRREFAKKVAYTAPLMSSVITLSQNFAPSFCSIQIPNTSL